MKALLVALVLLLLAAGGLYVAASWVPQQYQPADLTARERDSAAHRFYAMATDEFYNKAQVRAPFSLTLTQEEINGYLASMDEIAGLYPGGKPGEVRSHMERSGVTSPAVAIGEGVLTIMVRLSEYGKVLSADLAFEFAPDGRLRVRLREVRLGRLTVPLSLVRGRLREMKEKLVGPMRAAGGEESRGGLSAKDVSALLTQVVAAIDEEPISTDIPKFHQRVTAVELHDQKLTLKMEPATPSTRGR